MDIRGCQVKEKRIIRKQTHNVMVFDIFKRRMAVDRRHTKVVVDTELKQPGLEFAKALIIRKGNDNVWLCGGNSRQGQSNA